VAFINTVLLLIIIGVLWQRRRVDRPVAPKGRQIILDSCALIDGRIIALKKAGFVNEQLVIPEFIIKELQLLADGKNSHKRERARFGLDVAKQLRAEGGNHVVVSTQDFPTIKAVDDKLVALSLRLGALLYTTDYNLGKVAAIKNVTVLNVNELAQHLRPDKLPGERLTVKLVQQGQAKHQAVGYLDEGTMVVVDDAVKFVGKLVTVTVTQMHQTASGKMIFATLSK
jgi:uncharacterized protein YacL